jgi:hypothetical protein
MVHQKTKKNIKSGFHTFRHSITAKNSVQAIACKRRWLKGKAAIVQRHTHSKNGK